jgi:hypothetical protein
MRQVLFLWFFIMLSASTASAQSLDCRLKLLRDTATLRIAYRTDSPPFTGLAGRGLHVWRTAGLAGCGDRHR